jgi:invasion protein IalB
MLMIYTENDTYFGPELTKRMHDAFVAAGGNAEFKMLPAFGSDGHFLIDAPDAVPIWSPIVTRFLEAHSASGGSLQEQVGGRDDRKGEAALARPQLNLPQNIHYSNWQKLCFNSSDGTSVCRTTSSGTDDLDQVIVRVDFNERANGKTRVQIFVPQGADLQEGVKVKVDQGKSTQIPFTFCLTNICIAADDVDPAVVAGLQSGKVLELQLTDLNSNSVSTNLPLNQFAAVRKDAPAQIYDFGLDEE